MKKSPQRSSDSPHQELPSEKGICRNLINNSKDAIFIVNRQQQITYASPACYEMFGYTPAEFLETPGLFSNIVHPDNRGRYHQIWKSYTDTNTLPNTPFEWTWLRKDGKTVYTEIVFIPLQDEQGEPTGIQAIARNITKQKEAERRNKAFISLGKRLSSSVTVEEAATIIAEIADEVFSWDAFTFDLYFPEQNLIVSILNVDTIDGKRKDFPPALTYAPPTPRMLKVIHEGGILITNTGGEYLHPKSIMFGDVNRSSRTVLIVPVHNRKRTIALVSVHSYSDHVYDEEALAVLQALADHCGGALERIRTRDELQESEKKFRSLFEHVPDGVYQSTNDGKLLAVNRALAGMLGYDSTEELLNKDITHELYAKAEDRALFLEQIEKNNFVRNVEVHWKKKDGMEIVLLDNAHVVRDAQGKTLYYEGTLTDITDLKNIERALKASEYKFRVLVERMNEGLVQVDNNDVIQFVNNRYCELVGYSREELIGQRASDLLHDEQGKRLITQKNRLRQTGVSDKYEVPLRKKSGEIITVLISGSPVYDEKGNAIGSIGINLDITEQKQSEDALAAQKEFLRQVIDLNPSFIFAKDREGKFTLVNRAVAQAYGTTVEGLLGKSDADFNSNADEVEHFRRNDLDVMDSLNEKFIPEETITDSKGTIRWLQTIKRPILGPEGKANQLLGVATDITGRKNAEEAFRRSELRFRKIFEEGPIGMAILSPDLHLFDVNSALCTMLGYTREELLACSIAEITHPEDLEKDYRAVQKLLLGEYHKYSMEKRYLRKDKSIIWGLLTASIVRDVDGTILYGLGMIEDITERKRTEEMLLLLQSSVNQANESILITTATLDSPEPQIVFVNPAFTKITGYTADEVIGKAPRLLQGEKTDAAIIAKMHDQLAQGEEFHDETIVYRKDQTELYLEWHIAPIKNERGTITHFLSVQRDITARKAYTEALRKSEKRYRLFFEEDLTGDFIAQPDGAILECNPAFKMMFGFAEGGSVQEYNMNNFFPDNNSFSLFVERIRSQKKLVNDEVELQRVDGTPVVVIQNVIGIFGKDGTLRRFKGYVFDNTERKKLEKQLLHSQKMESIGTLAAGLAHNFNNIMNVILGYASALKIGSANPRKVAETVDAISLAVKRGTGLVRQLTTFARSNEPVLMSVNLNTLLQEMARIVKETFPETITCILDLSHDSASILADPNQLHQALLNLCVNARDAMHGGGTLTMKTFLIRGDELSMKYPEAGADRYVCICISDTGTGLDQETREHIFEPFFTTKDIGKGTGLGLSVVYGIVQNHNGFIEVESEPGNGAAFKIYFRVQAGIEKFVEEESSDFVEIPGGTETILIVEDEEMLLDLVKSLLELKGYKVYAAKDGAEALEIYKATYKEIAVVLSDMGLPKVGGWDLLQIMRELNPQAKILLASGYLDTDLRDRLIAGGAADFIQKPYDPDAILIKIRDLIDQ